jgi:hypothetical protein
MALRRSRRCLGARTRPCLCCCYCCCRCCCWPPWRRRLRASFHRRAAASAQENLVWRYNQVTAEGCTVTVRARLRVFGGHVRLALVIHRCAVPSATPTMSSPRYPRRFAPPSPPPSLSSNHSVALELRDTPLQGRCCCSAAVMPLLALLLLMLELLVDGSAGASIPRANRTLAIPCDQVGPRTLIPRP